MARERIYEALTATSGVYFDGEKTLDRTTPYQHLQVFETPDLGRVFKLDGCNMTSEKDEFFYHENLIHPAAIAHPCPRHALVVGGGDGGSVEELLKHATLQRVDLVELDPEVIAVSREQFAAVHRGAFADPRLRVTIGDGLAFLHGAADRYDLIVLDLTDPVGPSVDLYSDATFRLCRDRLAPGGALTLHIGSPVAHPERVRDLLRRLGEAFAVVAAGFVHVPAYGSVWGFAVASATLDPRRLARQAVQQRIADRRLTELAYYNEDMHHAIFALPNYIRRMLPK